ncbi:MAG: alpha/beta hydrolase [Bacteroidales bacterium]|nr:alpha/beta hydrolase [Bacteroidales bacterium]MCF8455189.1 alpha/beta hydrolase [Bacteroidales bacterium]
MKTSIFSTFLLMVVLVGNSQDLYIRTFGNKDGKALIFLHGGPGYNCSTFEITTAHVLANQGFFVVVYDRRGEGRSLDKKASFTFAESFKDLKSIYKKYKLKKATLIGHSFGGVLATLFAEEYPEKVQALVLVGAPVSLQKSFKNIRANSQMIYESKNDSTNLKYILMMEKMDTASLEYSSYCFMHAMQNGFYSPENPSIEAQEIYMKFQTDPILARNAAVMTYEAPKGFWANERYTSIDLTSNLKKLQSEKIPIYGLYGKDDGLYSTAQVKELQELLPEGNVKYLDNCSHSVYIDQQAEFIDALKTWLK